MPRRRGNDARRPAAFVPGARRRQQTVAAEIGLLVHTLRELAAIKNTAEDAAGCILAHAEELLASADAGEAARAQEALLSIMTACGFHDLVGQRVTKITATLDGVIASRVARTPRGTKTSRRAATAALPPSRGRDCQARASTRTASTRFWRRPSYQASMRIAARGGGIFLNSCVRWRASSGS